jgi:hypothetical protein
LLLSKIESAAREFPAINGKTQPEYIKLFRQAFFDVIIDLFLNYKKRVKNFHEAGDIIFDTRGFIDDSDAAHKDFFRRYFQINSEGGQSNN